MIFHLRDWSIMFQDLVQLSLTIFVFFQANWIGGNRRSLWTRNSSLWMQSSFRTIRVLQSVAPQTSTCSCRKPLVQKLDTFHNEYLSALYSQSRWLQNLRPLYYYFFFFTGFYFFLQGLKNVLLSTFKDSPQPLAAKKDIGGKKKPLLGHV